MEAEGKMAELEAAYTPHGFGAFAKTLNVHVLEQEWLWSPCEGRDAGLTILRRRYDLAGLHPICATSHHKKSEWYKLH